MFSQAVTQNHFFWAFTRSRSPSAVSERIASGASADRPPTRRRVTTLSTSAISPEAPAARQAERKSSRVAPFQFQSARRNRRYVPGSWRFPGNTGKTVRPLATLLPLIPPSPTNPPFAPFFPQRRLRQPASFPLAPPVRCPSPSLPRNSADNQPRPSSIFAACTDSRNAAPFQFPQTWNLARRSGRSPFPRRSSPCAHLWCTPARRAYLGRPKSTASPTFARREDRSAG